MARIVLENRHRILLAVLALLLCGMTVRGVRAGVFSSVALEQEPRCGLSEHTHTDECYVDELLHCGQKAHSHNGNCYVVLLKDNNINRLLTMMEQTESRSLEGIIGANGQILTMNASLTSLAPPTPGTAGGSLFDNGGLSGLTGSNGDVSTLAMRDPAVTNNYAVNFYIRLDGNNYVCIGNETGTGDWNPVVASTTIVNRYTSVVETGLTTTNLYDYSGNTGYFLRYNKNGNLDNFNKTGWREGNGVAFEGPAATYAVLSWNANDTDPVDFYTLTLNYTAGGVGNANEVKYVQENYNYQLPTLPSGSYWAYDAAGNNRYNDTTIRLTQATTLYAISPSRTVYYYNANGTSYRTITGVTPGSTHTLIAPPAGHIWVYRGTTNVAPGSITVNSDLQFQAARVYTITYLDQNGNTIETRTNVLGNTTHTLIAPPDGFLWVYDNNGTEAPPSLTVNSNLTFRAKPITYTVTYLAQDGSTILTEDTEILPGTNYTLIAPPNGCIWAYDDSGNKAPASISALGANMTFRAVPSHYTVTFIGSNGATTTTPVGYRENVALPNLPDGWHWLMDGTIYEKGGSYGPVEKNLTFRAVQRTITINYDVNFKRTGDNVGAAPYIVGTDPQSRTVRDTVGGAIDVRSLTSRKVREVANGGTLQSYTYYFRGWAVDGNTNVIIQPGAKLSWEQLAAYAGDDTLNLTGVWTPQNAKTSVSFYVRLDGVAVDTNGNVGNQQTDKYTPSVFDTYVGFAGSVGDGTGGPKNGVNYSSLGVADTTSDNSYGADQAIRALYGEKAEGVWLYDFPSDEDVFAYLQQYQTEFGGDANKRLTVEGEPVEPSELNHDYYAIRWYVFKSQTFWHVDGKLVRKKGNIQVEKVFGGTDEVLLNAADDFHVVAMRGQRDENGVFVPFKPGDKEYREIVMVLSEEDRREMQANHPNAEFIIWDRDSQEGELHTYHWLISDVGIGGEWQLEEHPGHIEGYNYYAEYSVYDTDGVTTSLAEYGTNAFAVGKVFALDEDPDQGLMVDFRNYYYDDESILIKKEDGGTGKPIGGAVFELYQNNKRLSFNYNPQTMQYERDEQGDGEFYQITTSDDGFSIISTSGFSYEHGDVVVKEVVAPAGYDPSPNITIGLADDGETVILKDIAGAMESEWGKYAEVPNNEVLVVKNNTSEYITVTATKRWNAQTTADKVEVVLQADGGNAADLFPGLANARVVLNAENNWTYTWTDLPPYANGRVVTWGIKEVKVGNDTPVSDGVNFANWIVTYTPGVSTDEDHDGDVDNWRFEVINTVRTPQLIITKVSDTGKVLSGAQFRLEQVVRRNGQWQQASGTVAATQTTDEFGILTFGNLTPGAYYRLTETAAPGGHEACFAGAILTVNGIGEIRQVNDDESLSLVNVPYLSVTRLYNLKVVNELVGVELPNTGGEGTTWYTQTGLLLIAAALALYVYKKRYRKEADLLDV